jgi:hypothetical protein
MIGFFERLDPNDFEEQRLSDRKESFRDEREGTESVLSLLIRRRVKGVSDSRFDDLSKKFGREKGEHNRQKI